MRYLWIACAALALSACGKSNVELVEQAVKHELNTDAVMFSNMREVEGAVCGEAMARVMSYGFQAMVDRGRVTQVSVYPAQAGKTYCDIRAEAEMKLQKAT